MSKSTFVKVTVASNGRDLSEMIESLSYEDCYDKDDLVTLKVHKDFALSAVDDEDIVAGKLLSYQFGFKGLEASKVRVAKISEINTSYLGKNKVTLTIKCLDMGQDMKQTSSQQVWKDKTSQQIIETIAARYGLKAVVSTGTKKWTSLAQANYSDYELLQYMALYESGKWVFYISGDELHYEPLDYSKKAKWLYTFGDNIMRFEPKMKTVNSGGATKTTVHSFDPKSKTPVSGSFGVNSAKGATGKNSSWSNDGVMLIDAPKTVLPVEDISGQPTFSARDGNYYQKFMEQQALKEKTSGSNNQNPEIDDIANQPTFSARDSNAYEKFKKMEEEQVAKNKAAIVAHGGNPNGQIKGAGTGLHGSTAAKILGAGLTIEGNPLLKATDILTITGVAKKHQGNWFVEKVTHTINGSGYVTTCEMHKNGSDAPNTVKPVIQGNVNSSKGDNNTKNTKEVKVVNYDVNGEVKK